MARSVAARGTAGSRSSNECRPIERTFSSNLRLLPAAAHIERCGDGLLSGVETLEAEGCFGSIGADRLADLHYRKRSSDLRRPIFLSLSIKEHKYEIELAITMTVRSVFIISPAKRVELIISYPAYIGRSFDEILRVLDALQLSANHRVATPANWRPGDDTVVLPFISDEEAERLFAAQGGFRKVRSYLRYVRDPSLRCL